MVSPVLVCMGYFYAAPIHSQLNVIESSAEEGFDTTTLVLGEGAVSGNEGIEKMRQASGERLPSDDLVSSVAQSSYLDSGLGEDVLEVDDVVEILLMEESIAENGKPTGNDILQVQHCRGINLPRRESIYRGDTELTTGDQIGWIPKRN